MNIEEKINSAISKYSISTGICKDFTVFIGINQMMELIEIMKSHSSGISEDYRNASMLEFNFQGRKFFVIVSKLDYLAIGTIYE